MSRGEEGIFHKHIDCNTDMWNSFLVCNDEYIHCICILGSEWSDSVDKASPPLPQSLPPEHCPGEEDREDHGGGEGEEAGPLCSGHWVSLTNDIELNLSCQEMLSSADH